MSVYELESFIKTNRKLPKMPSAEKVKAKGADIQQINTLLVEKIEELTLYVIDMQRQIDELKANE